MSAMATYVTTRGVVFVHSAPAALCPHITWALETVLGPGVRLDWTVQPHCPASVRTDSPLRTESSLRTEASWTGAPGTGAHLASALRACEDVRYEVVEEPSPGYDGARFSYTPALGIHHSVVSVNGDTMVSEDRLRAALRDADPHTVREAVARALGSPWDDELEPFRHAGENAQVRWLHAVG